MEYYLTPQHYEIAEKNGISADRLQKRFYHLNWSVERATTEPVRKMMGHWKQWKDVATQHGIKMNAFYLRVQRGMSPEEAATAPFRHTIRVIPEWVYEKGEANGLDRKLVYGRIKTRKWDYEKACTEPKGSNHGGNRRGKGGWK